MTSGLEQRLAEDLDQVATATSVPTAPVGDLLRAGKRRQQRRRWVAGLAGGLATLVIVGLGLAVGPRIASAPAPAPPGPSPAQPTQTTIPGVEELKDGPGPSIPYWHDGVLHIGDRENPSPRRIISAGSTTLVGSQTRRASTWQLVDRDRLVPLPTAQDATAPKISPDGRLVVWATTTGQTSTLTAWDVATQQVLASREVTVKAACCDAPFLIYGADSHGRVYYGSPIEGPFVWDTAADTTHALTGLRDLPQWPSMITANGPVFQGSGNSIFETPGVYGTVDEDGSFHRTGTVPTDQDGSWSPDATLFVYPADDSGEYVAEVEPTTMAVLDVATGQRRPMHLPPGTTGDVTWEFPTTFLVHTLTGPNRHFLVRCNTETAACEMALRVGRIQGWSFPERW